MYCTYSVYKCPKCKDGMIVANELRSEMSTIFVPKLNVIWLCDTCHSSITTYADVIPPDWQLMNCTRANEKD